MVAACVMTFEARDSAAKVVPARFKMNTNSAATGAGMGGGGGGSGRNNARNSSANRRTAGCGANLLIRLVSFQFDYLNRDSQWTALGRRIADEPMGEQPGRI